MDGGEVLLSRSETDIAVASITAAGIPGVVTIGNQQFTVEGGEAGSNEAAVQMMIGGGSDSQNLTALYHVNQLNEELLRGGEISGTLKSAVQVKSFRRTVQFGNAFPGIILHHSDFTTLLKTFLYGVL